MCIRDSVEAVRSAQREGYENITVDLIFGVPGFGNDTLRRSLDSALALGVQQMCIRDRGGSKQ